MRARRAKLDVPDWLRFDAGLRDDSYHIGQGPGALADYGQHVRGWRPPSLRETNYRLGETLYPNPALKPEKATNYEAGINVLRSDVLAGGDGLKFRASYFSNTYDDYIVRG